MAAAWKRAKFAAQHLRWRLTASYMAVTVGSLLTLVLILSALLFSRSLAADEYFTPEFWSRAATETVPTIRQILTTAPELLPLWIGTLETRSPPREIMQFANGTRLSIRHDAQLSVLVVGADGTLLAASNPELTAGLAPGEPLDHATIPELGERLALALDGETDVTQLSFKAAEDRIGFVVPIPDNDGSQILAALVGVVHRLPTRRDVSTLTVGLAARTLIVLLLGAGLIGALFGSLTAKGIVARFEHLAAIARSWSRGDFAATIDDPTGDELSQLGRHLNAMARQLDTLLAQRQAMAIAEERNRLARDLHDSAKQQALAASFQIGTALTLFEREPDAAREHLARADGLVNAVRKELTELVHQLRPPEPAAYDPADDLGTYARTWSAQTGIRTDISVTGGCTCVPAVNQALQRIMQEALANVARHSNAGTVRIALACDTSSTKLTVTDDGCGFDPTGVQGGLGLVSMRERTEALGGQFSLDTEPGAGTRIRAAFPVEPGWELWSERDEG